MNTNKKYVELTAPAGSLESLQAAIKAGADSVYFSLKKLNMRVRSAKSFDMEDLPQIVQICHHKKRRCYLTLNTLVYDNEISTAEEICDAAKNADIDGVIATDWSAIQYARKINLPVHVSTQANISNLEAVQFYSHFADVLVLARELTLDQIQAVCQGIQKKNILGPNGNPVAVEVFVHGALCVAIAGKCYMSLAHTGHSANRGDCFQICRRQFRVTDQETEEELLIDNQFVMSPKDLCTIGILDKIIGAGVSILKIEGRGRSPDYVFTVTKTYREAIDSVFNGTYSLKKIEQWEKTLETVYNRGFWQGGYYLGHKLGEWSASYGSQATRKKIFCGKVIHYFGKPKVAEILVQDGTIQIGDTIAIMGPTTGYAESQVTSLLVNDQEVDKAQKGERPTLTFPEKVRPNDKVFIFRDRTK